MENRKFLSALVFVAVAVLATDALTLKQFEITLKMVHDTCQTKTKAPEGKFERAFLAFRFFSFGWWNLQNCCRKLSKAISSTTELWSATLTASWKCCIWWRESPASSTSPISTPTTLSRPSCSTRPSKLSDTAKTQVSDFRHHFVWISFRHFCPCIAKGMTDPCEAAYTMLKCFKADNNEFWFR